MFRHRWRLAGVLLLVLTAGVVAYAATKASASRRPRVAEVLRARGFEIVDGKGRVAARLRAEPDGFAWLAVTDRTGRTRATIHVGKDGFPRVAVLDGAGLIRGSLLVTPDGDASCHLANGDEKRQVALEAGAGGPVLNMDDGRGVLRASLMMGEDGVATAILAGPDGRAATAIRVDARHSPHLWLLHHKQPLWAAP